MKELKALLKNECDMKVEDDVLDLFLSRAESVRVDPLRCIVEAGTYSPYMWIVKSGVDNVGSLSTKVGVYTLDGSEISTNLDPNSLELPAGIYIIKENSNGASRKVLIK